MILSFITVRWLDILDIFLVALLFYNIYKLIRGSIAVNIFIGVISFYLLWQIVNYLHMHLLSTILGQFMGVGVLALIIVFQQEIRRFFLLIGSRYISSTGKFSFKSLINTKDVVKINNAEIIAESMVSMSKSLTGALIVIAVKSELQHIVDTGVIINADIKKALIKSIFFKNSPLHDGAIVIRRNKIVSVRCVLPISNRIDLPAKFGLRHRSAIGVTETTDALALIVSEETGTMSYAFEGEVYPLKNKEAIIDVIKLHIS